MLVLYLYLFSGLELNKCWEIQGYYPNSDPDFWSWVLGSVVGYFSHNKPFGGYANWGGDRNMQSFNDDISRWDTSNVTTMDNMLYDTHAFNDDISRWDTY